MKNLALIKSKLKIRDIYDGEIIETSFGWKALCPFHGDTDPSFTVTEKHDGDLYYCHGCKTGGSVVDYVQNLYNYTFSEACKYIADTVGVEYEGYVVNDKYSSILNILNHSHKFFIDRGISEEILKIFGVGYIDDITKYDINNNLLANDKLIGNVKNSIFYPIRTRSGNITGYYFRPLYNSNSKYISNSQTQVFGLHAIDHSLDYIICVEGHNDVLKLHSAGFKNVVGLCGTNFNYNIMKVLADHKIKKIIILPDADSGGERFFNDIIDKYGTFDTCGVLVSVAWMDGFKGDPDEYVDKNRSFFDDIYKNSINIIKHVYNVEKELHDKYDIDIINEILHKRPYLNNYELQLSLKDKIGNITISKMTRTFYNIEFEKVVLGSMVVDALVKSKVLSEISDDVFVIDVHKNIFNFIKEHQSTSIDTIKLQFGIEFDKFDVGNISFYIDELNNLLKKRTFWNTICKYDYNVLANNSDITPVISSIMNDISEIASTSGIIDTVTSDIVVMQALDKINNDEFDGISINDKFPNMSTLMRGLPNQNLIIIAGNTGTGKTSFGLNIIDSVSYMQNYKTLILTSEMSPEDLMLRQFSIKSGLSYNAIIDRHVVIPPEEIKMMTNKKVIYGKIPIIEDTYNVLEIMYTKHMGFDVVFFDYLQLAMSNMRVQRHQQLKMLTILLKNFAMDFNCCVVAIAQMNKDNLNGDISEFKNLAGAYDMTQDGDIGITINQKKTENPIIDGNIDINMDKMRRNQDKVLIPAYYDRSCLRFQEMRIINNGK